MTNTLTKLLIGGGFILALGACDDPNIEGMCQLDLDGDPDCLLDGECNVDDPNDPDCEPCDYTPDAEECQPDPCEGANPPPECDPFVPGAPAQGGGGGVSINAVTGYDGTNGRHWVVDDNGTDADAYPYATILVTDDRYATTQNPAYRCGLAIELNDGSTLPAAAVTHEIRTQASQSGGEDTRDYAWTEVTFESGNFASSDWAIQTSAGVISGCSEKYVDPATWPDGISGPVDAADWAFGWGDMAPIIDELLTDSRNNDPNSDTDAYDLYAAGYIVGGGMGKPSAATPPWTAYYYAQAYAVGDDWKVVDSGNEDDPYVRLPSTDMNPAEGSPANGIYFLNSYNSWSARFILLDQSG